MLLWQDFKVIITGVFRPGGEWHRRAVLELVALKELKYYLN